MKYDVFEVDFRGAPQPAADLFHLVLGNMHIRTPSGGPTVSLQTRRRMVSLALKHLSSLGQDLSNKPVVRVLVGDPNLTAEQAAAAVQEATKSCSGTPLQFECGLQKWEIHSSEHGLSGDILFCSGAWIEPLLIPIGKSYAERGLRNDCHDAVGAVLKVPFTRCDSLPGTAPQAPEPPVISQASSSAPQAPAPSVISQATSGAPSGGASQPANEPEHWKPTGGASQPANEPEHWEPTDGASQPPSPASSGADWGGSEAEELHAVLRTAEKNEDEDAAVLEQLGRL